MEKFERWRWWILAALALCGCFFLAMEQIKNNREKIRNEKENEDLKRHLDINYTTERRK